MAFYLLGWLGCSRQQSKPEPPSVHEPKATSPLTVSQADLLPGPKGVMKLRNTGQPFTGTVRTTYPDGAKRATVAYAEGRMHGDFQVWHPNGKPAVHMHWLAGKKHGKHEEWHANGQRAFVREWNMDLPSGVMREWDEKGTTEWKKVFENGELASERVVENKSLTLAEAERKKLWDKEHHGLILSKYGFKPLQAALAARDQKQLAELLAPAFTAKIPAALDGVAADLGVARARRWDVGERQRAEVNAEGFVTWMLGHLKGFGKEPKAKVSLMSFAPVQDGEPGGDWNGNVRARFWGKGDGGQPMEFTCYFDILVGQPVKRNLQQGRWLRAVELTRMKAARADRPLMRDRASQLGIEEAALHDNWDHGPDKTIPNTGGVYAMDFNRDGCTDLMVTDVTLPRGHRLYMGTAEGRMVDVTEDMKLGRNHFTIPAFVDLDGDGWVDMINENGDIFRNLKGESFEDVTPRTNLAKLARLALTGKFSGFTLLDYDLDGRMDLYVFRGDSDPTRGSWINGQIGANTSNQLLRNVGNWMFEDVTETTGADGGKRSTFTTVVLDADNNQRPDLYVINEFGNGLLLLNQGPGKAFRSMELVDRAADFGSMGLTAGDFNNDGHIDLYVASMYSKSGSRVIGNLKPDAYSPEVMAKLRRMVAGSQLYRNAGGMEFEPIGKALDVVGVGWAYGPALVDLDNDGYLDIHATTGFISRTRDKPDG